MTNERRIPSSRLGRLSQLGRLAGGMVGGMVSEGARQLASGKRPVLGDLLLTPRFPTRHEADLHRSLLIKALAH